MSRDPQLTDEEIQLFWEKVSRPSGAKACWLWLAALDKDGYGVFWYRGGTEKAHRISYLIETGRFPARGALLDHKCRNHACIRPKHLEPVTHTVNVLRGISPAAKNAARTECENGHPFTAENTYVRPGRESRECRECQRQRTEARRRR